MPRTFEPLPPDDPIFSRGVFFVFRDEPDVTPAEEDEVEFVSPSVPGRRTVARELLRDTSQEQPPAQEPDDREESP